MNAAQVRILVLLLLIGAGYFVISTLLEAPPPDAVSDSGEIHAPARPTGEPTPPPTAPAPTDGKPADGNPTERTAATADPDSNDDADPVAAGSGAMSGLVMDKAGNPLEGVQLALFRARSTLISGVPLARTSTDRATVTNADGYYAFEDLAPGNTYLIQARAPGYARGELRGLSILADAMQLNPNLVLGTGQAVSGTVLALGGEPVPQAGVELYDLMANLSLFNARQAREPFAITKTADDGTYAFANVDFTSMEVVVRHPRHTTMAKTYSAPFSPAQDRVIDFLLRDPATIAGMVVDERGAPLAEVRLQAIELTPRPDVPGLPPPTTSGQATSDANGRFEITGLRQDSNFNLLISADGFSDVQQTSRSDVLDVRIALEPQGGVAGAVRTADGTPVTRFKLRVMIDRTPPSPINRSIEPFDSPDGSFTLDGVDPGQYFVEVRADDFAPTPSATFQIERGRITPDVVITLTAGATLVGRVTRPDGSPAAGARITVHDNNYSSNALGNIFEAIAGASALPDPSTRTAADGAFLLRALPAGTRQVEVRLGQAPPVALNNVQLRDGETTDVGSIALPAGGTLRGHCVDARGATFTDGFVSCLGAGNFSDQQRIDGNGYVEFPGLAPGTYSVRVNPESIAGESINQIERLVLGQKTERTVVVTAGQVTDIQLVVPAKESR